MRKLDCARARVLGLFREYQLEYRSDDICFFFLPSAVVEA